jgi:hypothetical protein
MELEYLGVILEAKKEDYTKLVNLKKFYKETLTEEEYKNFEKMLKTKKSEVSELESIVKKMNAYSDQYAYERIMAMSESEFDAIKEREIESKKNEIRKHNKDINDKNISLNSEIDALNDEITLLKRELDEMTAEIGETGKYTKDTVKRAKTIKEKIQEDNEKIKKAKETIEENDKSIITSEDISIDFESYKKEKINELSGKKYLKNIPEVSALDEFLCKVQKKGKTPEEIETAMNSYKECYIGGYQKEGYEYFDPIYRNDFGCLDEDDFNASDTTELLEKYFEVVEKGTKGDTLKGRIERNKLVGYNTNKKHNISEITKEKLLNELISGLPFYKTTKDNSVLTSGTFLSLTDRINIQTKRLNKVAMWTESHTELSLFAKLIDFIEEFFELTKNRETEEKNIDSIYDIYKKLRKGFSSECFIKNKDALEYITLYDSFSSSCNNLKALASEKSKLSGKKIVINKKEHSKTVDKLEEDIVKEQENIRGLRKKMKDSLDRLSDYLYGVFDEPEAIMYPESSDIKENIFNVLHSKTEEFSLAYEQDYLKELENDLLLANKYLEKYEEATVLNRKAAVVKLCDSFDVQSVSQSVIDVLMEEKNKKGLYKASEISARINEARVNLYLREQKEKAVSDASKAKSEILGAVLNHLDLEETKTDIFAAI